MNVVAFVTLAAGLISRPRCGGAEFFQARPQSVWFPPYWKGAIVGKRGFLFPAMLIFASGCAAPMTEMVATRQSGKIDRTLFEEGGEVWITYQDKMGRLKTERGVVLDADSNSVRLNTGWKGEVKLEYRWMHTISHPVKDRLFVSLSAGTFWVLVPLPHELPHAIRLTGAGLSIRNKSYTNPYIEMNLSLGDGGPGLSSWISTGVSAHFYTIVPGFYVLFGLGSVVPRPTDEFNVYHGRYSGKYLALPRFGIGVTNHISKRFNIRAEIDLIGLRIYLDRMIH